MSEFKQGERVRVKKAFRSTNTKGKGEYVADEFTGLIGTVVEVLGSNAGLDREVELDSGGEVTLAVTRLEPLTPEKGMPVTYSVGSDRYGAIVTEVTKSGKTIEITHVRRSGGTERLKARKDRHGVWRVTGRGYPVRLGEAVTRLDPHF